MSFKKRLLLGMASGAGSVVIKTSLNILLIPLLIHTLGVELYGLYVLLISVVELTQLMDFGSGTALVKLLCAMQTAGNHEMGQDLIRMSHLFYLGITILTIALGLGLVPLFPHLFHLPVHLISLASMAVFVVLIEGVLNLYTAFYRSILVAHCLYQWINYSDTLFNVIATVAGICLVLNGWGLLSLLAARLAADLVRSVILIYQAQRLEPTLFRLQGPLKPQVLKDLFGQSMHAVMISLSIQISHKIDSFVIAFFLPLSAVGIYELVFRFLTITLQIGLKISEGVFPLFTRMNTPDQKPQMQQLFLRVSSLTNFVVSILLLLIVVFYPDLFRMLSDSKIPIQATWALLAVAVPIMWSGGLQMPTGPYLYATGHQWYLTISSLLAAFSNLILSVILVQYFGIVGVALGTLIPQLIQHQASLVRKVCQLLGVGFWQYIREVHAKVLLPLLIGFVWIQLLQPLFVWGRYPILPIGIISVSTLLISGTAWFLLNGSPTEKATVLARIQPLLGNKPGGGGVL